MKTIINRTLLSLAVSMALSAPAVSANSNHEHQGNSSIKHVLLISVDGLRQIDLDWFVKKHPESTLAAMVASGTSYSHALTPFPSDYFPGMVGQVTGGNPASTGIYYDDAYNRSFLPAGTSNSVCTNKTVAPGAAVTYAENIEPVNADGNFVLDAGQGIAGLYPINGLMPGILTSVPANIMTLVGGADDVRNKLIDPSQLPVNPITCKTVYPHEYLQVNTIFEVAHAKGLHTAWSDKHPAYEILNGPSGYGIDDLFAPEINSVINLTDPNAPDWTKNNVNTQRYDTIKVLSVINEINGYDHSGTTAHGTPAIFGMNFQAVSTAQKLNKSPTPENSDPNQLGGYDGTTPGPVLESALKFVDDSLLQMQEAITKNTHTHANTVIILSAKHGQSPQKRSDLTIINDGAMLDALEAAWSATSPSITPLVAHAIDDDGVLLWLNDRSKTATHFVKDFLIHYAGTGVGSDATGGLISKPFTSAGLSKILAGNDAAKSIGVNFSTDQRTPDVIGYAKVGSVYAKSSLSKIAEHGGHALADRAVPIVVWGASIGHQAVEKHVDTIQIAPTILHLLGLNPRELQAVKIEGTQVLPELN